MKTYTACPSCYDKNNAIKGPAERRVTLVTQEYSRKFKKLDEKFAADAGGEDGTVVGPFQAAQQ